MEFLGINDMRNCFTKGDAMACVSMVVGLVPWGKIFKVGKLVAGIKRAFEAVNNLRKMYARAEQMLKRANQMRESAKQALSAAANAVGGAAKRAGQKAKNAVEAIGKKGCRSNSFTPTTRVLMADGSTKPINEVKVGDKVQSTNPATGKTQSREVTATITGQGFKHLVTITIDTNPTKPGVQAAQITATDGHPFWTPELHLWTPAANLQTGQLLQTSTGTWVQITAIEHSFAVQRVHNLTITSDHTYHALAGNTPILNHNCDGVLSSSKSVDENRDVIGAQPEGHGFTGVYNPMDRSFEARLSSGPNALVSQQGGHGVISSDVYPGNRNTMGFVAIVREGGLEVRWNSLSVNMRHFGRRSVPEFHRENILNSLRSATGLEVWG